MKAVSDRFNYLFRSTKGLILVAIALIAIVTAMWGMLSGPLREWGISDLAVRLYGMKLVEAEREGRIILLYHAIAMAVVAIERNSANFYDSRDPDEAANGKQGDTTPVGFYNGRVYNGYRTQDARSPYGLYDMAGNVWQWVSDITDGTHDRYLLGGSKDSYGYNLRVWTRNSARPDYYSPSVGFRCAR
jgi:Sulfatase-modifying factor enzyme 1